ncbi:MAG: hypothetical protein AMXMBFR68_12030 [Ignavibacteria bacterium]
MVVSLTVMKAGADTDAETSPGGGYFVQLLTIRTMASTVSKLLCIITLYMLCKYDFRENIDIYREMVHTLQHFIHFNLTNKKR